MPIVILLSFRSPIFKIYLKTGHIKSIDIQYVLSKKDNFLL